MLQFTMMIYEKFETFIEKIFKLLSEQQQWEQFQHLEAEYFKTLVLTFQTSLVAIFLNLLNFFEKQHCFKNQFQNKEYSMCIIS